uniref:ATP-dependent DNA helicase n=1 Tax=Tanacetum cinerariifolium TaxID=118510 RepID=A0A6L2P878_TANCI|nr:DNA helicase [Tanacetum cinerariifolium]
MSMREYVGPNDDHTCEEDSPYSMSSSFSNIRVSGGLIHQTTPALEQSTDGYDVQVAHAQTIGDGANVMTRSLIRSADFVDVTTVPVSRIFDRFRRMCLNTRRSDYVNTSGNPHRLVAHKNETTCVRNAVSLARLTYGFEPDLLEMQVTVSSMSRLLTEDTRKLILRSWLIIFESLMGVIEGDGVNDESGDGCRIRIYGFVVESVDSLLVTPTPEHASGPVATQMQEDNVSYIDLGNCNQQCWLFSTARDKCSAGEILGLKIRLCNKGGIRGYELLTSNLLGGIVFEDGPNSRTDFDVIIEFRGGLPQRISKVHQSVFEQKFNDFIKFLKYEKPFCYVTAFLYTIEFQKRGLPHYHILLCVGPGSKITNARQIDNYISAEIPDPVEDPTGYKVVTELMMHGSCAVANPGAACTEIRTCSKNFPKKYNDITFFDTNGHTHYRRKQPKIHVMKGESRLDNYNQRLSLAFHAYINVEYYGWSMLIKYLFKYISKGPDRILAKVSKPIGDTSTSVHKQRVEVDEIQNYVDAEVQTINGQVLPTYRAACEALGLLGDDKEYDIALEESAVSASSVELRTLFAPILIYCDVADPPKLWQNIIASSGIASLLLPVGRIAHSRFKLPLDLTDKSVCHAKKHSQLANMLIPMDLFIWDKVPINDGRCFEVLDRTLRDLMNAPEILFGGKTVILDFWQTLPVKKRSCERRDDSRFYCGILFMATFQSLHVEREYETSEIWSSTKMSQTTIAALKVRQENCVLEVKVYRKWVSKTVPEMKPIAFCCILIDRETLENPVSLRFRKITTFEILMEKESEFPKHHFEFIAYNQLQSKVPYVYKNSKMIYSILTEAASTDVQLEATLATYYYINPQIPEAENTYTMFKEKYYMNPPI